MGDEPKLERAKWIYVVDDDDAFRASLVALLQADGWAVAGFQSLDEFSSTAETLRPGLVLLDLHLGASSGLDLIESAPAALDRFAVVMVTGAGEVASAVRAMKAGAADFIEKSLAPDEFMARVEAAHACFMEELGQRAERLDARDRMAKLSGREREVLQRLLSGASNKIIARDLGLSPRTVEMHRARMVAKLGVATTAQALETARRAGAKWADRRSE